MKKSIYILAVAMTALSLTACGGKGDGSSPSGTTAESVKETVVDLEEVHDSVKEVYGDSYIPSFAYDAQALKDVFGVSEDLYEEFVAEGPMISVHVDTFLALKAKSGKGADLEKALIDYKTGLVESSTQYPMNLSKVQASLVLRHGDYVFFIMLGTPSQEAEAQGEEAALESAREENQKAVEVIEGFFN